MVALAQIQVQFSKGKIMADLASLVGQGMDQFKSGYTGGGLPQALQAGAQSSYLNSETALKQQDLAAQQYQMQRAGQLRDVYSKTPLGADGKPDSYQLNKNLFSSGFGDVAQQNLSEEAKNNYMQAHANYMNGIEQSRQDAEKIAHVLKQSTLYGSAIQKFQKDYPDLFAHPENYEIPKAPPSTGDEYEQLMQQTNAPLDDTQRANLKQQIMKKYNIAASDTNNPILQNSALNDPNLTSAQLAKYGYSIPTAAPVTSSGKSLITPEAAARYDAIVSAAIKDGFDDRLDSPAAMRNDPVTAFSKLNAFGDETLDAKQKSFDAVSNQLGLNKTQSEIDKNAAETKKFNAETGVVGKDKSTQKLLDKANAEAQKLFDNTRSPLATQINKVNAAQHAQAGILQARDSQTGQIDPDKIPPSVYEELATSVGSLLSTGQGGQSSEAQRKGLQQATLIGDVNKMRSYFSGQPFAATTSSFLTYLSEQIGRQGAVADKIIDASVAKAKDKWTKLGLSPDDANTVFTPTFSTYKEFSQANGVPYYEPKIPRGATAAQTGKMAAAGGQSPAVMTSRDDVAKLTTGTHFMWNGIEHIKK